jgi:Lar family restriction alleviation protein
MPEIRRCPFCGGDKIIIRQFDDDAYMATCEGCGASTAIKKTSQAARTSWNMRAALKEEALGVVGKISLSCPKCGTHIHGDIKPKYKEMGILEYETDY